MNGEVVYKEILGFPNKAMIIHQGRYLDKINHMRGTGARHMGAPGKLIIWRLEQAWWTYLRAPFRTAGNLRRKSFARVKKNLTTGAIFPIIPVTS